MSGFDLPRDKNGHVVNWETSVLSAMESFEFPEYWPADVGEVRKVMHDYATGLGAAVALGSLSVDAAYLSLRKMCQSAEDSSRGQISGLYWFCTVLLDRSAERFRSYFLVVDDKAERALVGLAKRLLEAGRPVDAVRSAMADAALKMDPRPPVDLLWSSLGQAIAYCRSNAKWTKARAMGQ